MFNFFKNLFKKLKDYNKIANIEEMARRYFAMNSFDGLLTIIGVIIGNYIAKVNDPKIIISTGLGVSIAMGISGIWGTYLTEQAERKKKVLELEKLTLKDLDHTKIAKAEKAATIIISLVDGISPFLSALLTISPFFIYSYIGINTAYIISISIAFTLLLIIGGFLGHISNENILISGLKMVLAGIICSAIILILGFPV